MKRLLLLVPLLLAACAPAAYSGPKPAPGEVIVEATSSSSVGSLSDEQAAGVTSFAAIAALLIRTAVGTSASGLPDGYGAYSFAEGDEGIKRLGEKDQPLHVQVNWHAVNDATKQSIDVRWESLPIGGKFVRVGIQARSTATAVNTRALEDTLLGEYLKMRGIRLVASGR